MTTPAGASEGPERAVHPRCTPCPCVENRERDPMTKQAEVRARAQALGFPPIVYRVESVRIEGGECAWSVFVQTAAEDALQEVLDALRAREEFDALAIEEFAHLARTWHVERRQRLRV